MGMSKRRALVTGANSGMGLATSVALARAGFDVTMLCRSRERGEKALQEARARIMAPSSAGPAGAGVAAVEPGSAELLLCDLGDYPQVRKVADEFAARVGSLDVIVNNAGVISLDRRTCASGHEQQFGVNHLGHFLLVSRLLPCLERAAKERGEARVVVVSSGAHKIGKIHFDDIDLERGYSGIKAYGQAKLANLLFARELSRRVEGSGIIVNACHPGAVATSMGVDRSTGSGSGIMGLLKPFFRSPERGADCAVWLATAPEAAAFHGEYFMDRHVAPSSKRSKDRETALRLWELSGKLTEGSA